MQRIEATEAGSDFAELVRRVFANGESHIFERDGEPLAALVPIGDLQKLDGASDEALRRSEARYRTLTSVAPVGIFHTDAQGLVIYVNEKWCEIGGMSSEEAMGTGWHAALHPEDRERIAVEWDEFVRGGTKFSIEYRYRRPDDVIAYCYVQAVPETDRDGKPTGYIGCVTDITERKLAEDQLGRSHEELERTVAARTAELAENNARLIELIAERERAEDALRKSEERLTHAVESIPDGFALFDPDDRLTLFNEPYRKVYPHHADVLVSGSRFEDMLRKGVERGEFADAVGREEEWIAERVNQHQNPTGPFEQRLANGRWLRIEEKRTPEGGIVGLRTDITDLMAAEARVRASEERFRDYAGASADWFWEMDADLRFTYMSPNVERIVGVSAEWHYGKTREDLLGNAYDRDVWQQHLDTLRARKPFRDFTYRRVGEGIQAKWLRTSGVPVFAEDGTFFGYRGSGSDITVAIEAEIAMRESEEQLRQAQKMEAVGQLTGGVAHDFNNLLAVTMGNLELLEAELNEADPRGHYVQGAIEASRHGAELTQRLLAFSRQQPLQPKSIDLARLVQKMSDDLLKRTLGETIAIEIVAESDLWLVLADPGQVENALLNLSINARDAMPRGGNLTIECANAQLDEAYVAENLEASVGDYVSLAVTDNGVGMPVEVQEHAFEPFFTTKEVGAGSGLGLSIIYGFTRQSGGHVIIYSEEGQGTTVKLYLPRDQAAAQSAETNEPAETPRGRGELVLVIEDDAKLRELAVTMVTGLGYRVTDVPEAASARAVLERGDKVDLVLSDVILPGGQSGPEFADEVKVRHPALRIIFMSGYPAEAARRNGFVGSDKVLLNKPFRRRQLAKALREALDR